MIKKTIPLWTVYLIYGGLLSMMRWEWRFNLVYLWLGLLAGMGLELIDRLVYVYLIHPQDQLSLYVKHYLKTRRFKDTFMILRDRGNEQKYLVSRSLLFMLGWVGVATYLITSTGSIFAAGVVLGAGLHLFYDLARDWHDLEKLKGWLGWQIKRPISNREIKVLVGVFGVFFAGLTIMVGL